MNKSLQHTLLFSLFISAFMLFGASAALAQCGDSIDLATWIQEGNPANGNWVVTGGGNAVNQTINGDPTFYVSPDSFINVIIKGDIQVTTAADDDWIGFVFGYNDPDPANPNNYDFYLFDWKQANQNFAGFFGNEGYALTKIDGPVTNFPQAFSAKAGPFATPIATQYGPTEGWNDFQVYSFALTYTNTRTVISLNGDTVIDEYGCFPPGRFGFYNYSQSNVQYSNFTYRVAAAFDVLTPNVCIGDTAQFIALSDSCENAAGIPVNNTLVSWFWTFGDGGTSNDTNASHLYLNPGTYNVSLVVTDYLGCTDTAYSTVEVFDVATDLPLDTTICVGDVITLDAGTSATAYTWSTGETTQTINVGDSGQYKVTVSGGLNCLAEDSITISTIPLPIVNLGPDTNICTFQDTVVLFAGNPGANYLWNTGDTLDSLVVNTSGEYIVTVSYPSGCSNSDTVNVGNFAQPTVSPPNPQLCIGDTVTISVSGAITYMWFPAAGLSATTGNSVETFTLVDTTYSVIGIDTNGCTDTSDFFVDVHDLPTVSITGGDTICAGDSVQLTINLTGDAPWYFEYKIGQDTFNLGGITNPSFNMFVSDSGFYTPLFVSDAFCSNSGGDSTFVYVQPSPNITFTSANDSVCFGDSITITASGAAVYEWTPSVGLNNTSVPTVKASPPYSVLYFVEGTTTIGCTDTASFYLEVAPLPVISINAAADSVCKFDTTTIMASGASTYVWNASAALSALNQATVEAFPINTETFTVTGTDLNGCSNVNDTTIIVLELPNVNVFPNNGHICVGEEETLIVPNIYSYQWDQLGTLVLDGNNNDTVIASPVDTTLYTLIATDTLGCHNTFTYELDVTPLPVPVITSPIPITCAGQPDSISITGALSYSWGPNIALIGGNTANPVMSPQVTTQYYVTATGPGNCQSIDSVTVEVFEIPNYSAGANTTICRFDTVQLNASGGESYEWSPSTGLSDPNVADPMTFTYNTRLYTVDITDSNGCTFTSSMIVTVNPLPKASAGADKTVCFGDETRIGGQPSGPAGSTYIWTPTAGLSDSPLAPNPRTSPDTTTTYTVLVTDTNGCINENEVIVFVNPLPIVEVIEEPNYICEGDSQGISVTPGLATYNWRPSNDVVTPNQSFSLIYPKIPSQYTVEVTDSNGCESEVSFDVDVKPKPFVNAGINHEICDGDTIELIANAAEGKYLWTPEEMVFQPDSLTTLAVPLGVAFLRLSVTDNLGCTNYDDAIISAHPLPYADAGEDIENCDMQTVFLGGPSVTSEENTIRWSPAALLSNPSIEHPWVLNTERDTFYLEVVSPDGCINYDTVSVNSDCYSKIYIPNAFSPDNDGINDVFRVYGHRIYNPYLKVYDKWGHIIFESNDLEVGWDGTHPKNASDAAISTFFWDFIYENERGRVQTMEGTVNLIR